MRYFKNTRAFVGYAYTQIRVYFFPLFLFYYKIDSCSRSIFHVYRPHGTHQHFLRLLQLNDEQNYMVFGSANS